MNSKRIQNTTKIISQSDNTTFRQLISGSHVNFSPQDALEIKSAVYPKTNSSWMEIRYQWLKSDLTTYVVINSSSKYNLESPLYVGVLYESNYIRLI